MMNLTVFRRLEALERATERVEVPSLIIVSYDEENAVWVAQEQYMKRDGKGNVVRGGYSKLVTVEDLEDYTPPKGFRGTMIIEEPLED